MRWPLRYQILLPFAAVMLLVLSGASLLNAYLAAARTEQQIARQLRDIARTLSAATFPLPDPVLKQMHSLSGAEFVLVADDGSVLASSEARLAAEMQNAKRKLQDEAATVGDVHPHPTLSSSAALTASQRERGLDSELGTRNSEPVALPNSERGTRNSKPEARLGGSLALPAYGLGEILAVGGERYFHSSLAVEGRGSRGEPAVVHILYPEAVWREARWQAAWPPLAVGAAALVLVAILAFALAERLSRPIMKLRGQVGDMAKGRYEPLPLPARDDEIRDLMASVNSLAAQLRELEQAIARAERLAILGQLSGGLIHHLRNDVTGARMAVQLHQRHCREEDQESMAVVLRQLKLTEEHLQRFLATDVPREPRAERFDLRTTVDDLQTLLAPTCRHRKVDLQVCSGEEPVILNADPAQVRQMLLNLVLNGIDAAGGSAGGWVKIEVAQDAQRKVRVRVTDSGPGAPSGLEAKLFEPLVTGKPEGIGLGLAVARQVAESHGGSVQYSHGPETCFEVVLPGATEVAQQHGHFDVLSVQGTP